MTSRDRNFSVLFTLRFHKWSDWLSDIWACAPTFHCCWLHANQFAELAVANFLHSIYPANVAAANSANTVLARQSCSAKKANSTTRLTISDLDISGSDVPTIHEWDSSSQLFSNWANRAWTSCLQLIYTSPVRRGKSCCCQTANSNRVQQFSGFFLEANRQQTNI